MLNYIDKMQHQVYSDKEVNVCPIYITVDDGIRLSRALNREQMQTHPNYEEMCRRFLADQEDFSEEKIQKAGINRRFENDNLDVCVRNITYFINSMS